MQNQEMHHSGRSHAGEKPQLGSPGFCCPTFLPLPPLPVGGFPWEQAASLVDSHILKLSSNTLLNAPSVSS